MGCGASKDAVGPETQPGSHDDANNSAPVSKAGTSQPAKPDGEWRFCQSRKRLAVCPSARALSLFAASASESKAQYSSSTATASHVEASTSAAKSGGKAHSSDAAAASSGAKEKDSAAAAGGARSKNTGRVADYYEIGPILGKGGFGEVKAATSKEDGRRYVVWARLLQASLSRRVHHNRLRRVAVKIISKLKFAVEDEENVKNEVDLMHRVRGNSNVVRQVQCMKSVSQRPTHELALHPP